MNTCGSDHIDVSNQTKRRDRRSPNGEFHASIFVSASQKIMREKCHNGSDEDCTRALRNLINLKKRVGLEPRNNKIRLGWDRTLNKSWAWSCTEDKSIYSSLIRNIQFKRLEERTLRINDTNHREIKDYYPYELMNSRNGDFTGQTATIETTVTDTSEHTIMSTLGFSNSDINTRSNEFSNTRSNSKSNENSSSNTRSRDNEHSSTNTNENSWNIGGSVSATVGFNGLFVSGEVTATVSGGYANSKTDSSTSVDRTSDTNSKTNTNTNTASDSNTDSMSLANSRTTSRESSRGNTATQHITRTHTVSINSLSVTIGPRSKITVTHYIYFICKEFTFETDYEIVSHLNTQALNFMHPNGTECTLAISDGERLPLHNHLRLLLSLPSADKPNIIQSDDVYIMKNVSGMKKLCNNVVSVDIGQEEPL